MIEKKKSEENRKCRMLIFLVLFIVMLSECNSAIVVPKSEIQSIAWNDIQTRYSSAISIELLNDNYDETTHEYNMFFQIINESPMSMSYSRIFVNARSVYNMSNKTWERPILNQESSIEYPNMSSLPLFLSGESEGGYINIENLNYDDNAAKISLDIDAYGLVCYSSNGNFGKNKHVLTTNQHLICDYTIGWSLGSEDLYIDLGFINGGYYTLVLRTIQIGDISSRYNQYRIKVQENAEYNRLDTNSVELFPGLHQRSSSFVSENGYYDSSYTTYENNNYTQQEYYTAKPAPTNRTTGNIQYAIISKSPIFPRPGPNIGKNEYNYEVLGQTVTVHSKAMGGNKWWICFSGDLRCEGTVFHLDHQWISETYLDENSYDLNAVPIDPQYK